jgi:atypical dual specificity phosphatase
MRLLRRLTAWVAYYPSWLFSEALFALGVWHKWDWIAPGVLLGAVPSRRDMARLRGMGIASVVNLCDEFAGHARELASQQLRQLRLPTIDYGAPSVADLRRGVAFIRDELAAGRKVYVHCKAGRKRAPTLALCWLISTGLSPQHAQRTLSTARRQVSPRLWRDPAVREFQAQA